VKFLPYENSQVVPGKILRFPLVQMNQSQNMTLFRMNATGICGKVRSLFEIQIIQTWNLRLESSRPSWRVGSWRSTVGKPEEFDHFGPSKFFLEISIGLGSSCRLIVQVFPFSPKDKELQLQRKLFLRALLLSLLQ